MGTLTREQMARVIEDGGSVLHGGRLITRLEHLPTEADLAKGNPEREAAAAAALDAQIAALMIQRDQLGQRTVRTGATVNPDHLATLQGALQPPPGDLATDLGQPGQITAGAGHESTEHVFHAVVGQELTDRLIAAGYGSPYAVDRATDEELRAIEGIGPKTLEKLRAATAGAGKE